MHTKKTHQLVVSMFFLFMLEPQFYWKHKHPFVLYEINIIVIVKKCKYCITYILNTNIFALQLTFE